MPHPYILLVSLLLTAPLIGPLARVFFGTLPQFADDAGLRPLSAHPRWTEVRSTFGSRLPAVLSTALLDLMGFFVAYAAVVAVVYHVLVWTLSFFSHDL
jgi:hypothetical protein